ncbi:MAG: hypothetical protein R3A12_07745 [Ignavibacteria bacterium]
MFEALQEFESAHPEKCDLIPSEDQFYGATRGVNRLSPHIQWVFVSASKDATEESEESKTSALGQLLARTVRSKVNFDEKVNDLRNDAKRNMKLFWKLNNHHLMKFQLLYKIVWPRGLIQT